MSVPADDLSLSRAVLGDSARVAPADAAESPRRGPRAPVPPGAWVDAALIVVLVTALGIAEVQLVGLPGWLQFVYAALGLAIAGDRLRQAKRARKRGALQPLEPTTGPALPAPAALADATAPAPANATARGPAPEAPALPPAQPAEAPTRASVSPATSALRVREPEAATAPSASDATESNPAVDDGEQTGDAVVASRRALGYTSLIGGDPARELAADVETITAWCAESGLTVVKVVHDVGERGALPALQWALDRIAAGEADSLVVPRLRCLSPSVGQLPPLLRWFTDPRRTLVAVDLRLDTATDAGRLAAFALAGVGGWESERLSARTRRGLAAARSRGAGRAGAAVADLPELRIRIMTMRSQGMTLQAIANMLNEEGVPTVRGGAKWRPSSVQSATGYRRPSAARGIHPPQR